MKARSGSLAAVGLGVALLALVVWQLDWLDDRAGGVTAIMTIVLALITGYYAWETRRMAKAAVQSAELTHVQRRDAGRPIVRIALTGSAGGPPSVAQFVVRRTGTSPCC